MIDYKNLLYEEYKILLDEIEKYNKYFLSKPPLEEIRLEYYPFSYNIGSKDLDIVTNNILTKTIIISNMPPTEIKKDVIKGLSFLDSKKMTNYIYDKQFDNTPKKYTSEVKKAILKEIVDIENYEQTKHYELTK